jgi:hypothetical protein
MTPPRNARRYAIKYLFGLPAGAQNHKAGFWRGSKTMKLCMFHLMPYRDLPADFNERYNSPFIDPLWFDVADAEKVGEYYNATLDELLHAAKAGMHGVCTNQHHQNV